MSDDEKVIALPIRAQALSWEERLDRALAAAERLAEIEIERAVLTRDLIDALKRLQADPPGGRRA